MWKKSIFNRNFYQNLSKLWQKFLSTIRTFKQASVARSGRTQPVASPRFFRGHAQVTMGLSRTQKARFLRKISKNWANLEIFMNFWKINLKFEIWIFLQIQLNFRWMFLSHPLKIFITILTNFGKNLYWKLTFSTIFNSLY